MMAVQRNTMTANAVVVRTAHPAGTLPVGAVVDREAFCTSVSAPGRRSRHVIAARASQPAAGRTGGRRNLRRQGGACARPRGPRLGGRNALLDLTAL
jgi:hypothetical protein